MTLHRCFLSVLLLLGVIASPAMGAPVEWNKPTISDNTTWSGEIVLRQNVVVSTGATLRILPGTSVTVGTGKGIEIIVLGRLLVEGEEAAKVTFLPEKPKWTKVLWGGVRLSGGPHAGHSLSGFRIEGARDGITLTETSARIANGVFAACETGIRGNQKSQAAVDNCLFDGNDAGAAISLGGEGIFRRCRLVGIEGYGIVADKGAVLTVSDCSFSRGKTGIFTLTNSPCRVEDSTFQSLEKGIAARQVGRNSIVSRCSFENDGAGVLAVQFCAIEIADSSFRENLTGVDVQEFSTPYLHHNRFERNQAAINLFRKSHAKVERNVFLHNRNGVVMNYSSYPLIVGNDFERNEMAVRLERYMSGDWEERVGSQGLTGAEMARRVPQTRNAGPTNGKIPFPKRVNARGNYWGSDADRDPARGVLGKIWDGKKFGPFRVEGADGTEYLVDIDVVDFSEEALSPVPGAGPRAVKPEAGETR